jgi:hypothetical protein
MDCLKSFNFQVSGSTTATSGNLNAWGIATNYNFIYDSFPGSSTLDIQGFKNIDVFKLKVTGYIQSTYNFEPAIITDWNFFVRVNGQDPLPTAVVNPTNNFGLSLELKPLIPLGKYNQSIEFISPINSVSSLQIENLWVQGRGAETNTLVNLNWTAVFTVIYKFEGE